MSSKAFLFSVANLYFLKKIIISVPQRASHRLPDGAAAGVRGEVRRHILVQGMRLVIQQKKVAAEFAIQEEDDGIRIVVYQLYFPPRAISAYVKPVQSKIQPPVVDITVPLSRDAKKMIPPVQASPFGGLQVSRSVVNIPCRAFSDTKR